MLEKTLVMKFGGTSVGTAQAMQQVAAIVRKELASWPQIVVVTSALSGVTNLLLDAATASAAGQAQAHKQAANEIQKAHFRIAEKLIQDIVDESQTKEQIQSLIADFSSLCQAIYILGEATPRALDAVASLGERMSAILLSAVMRVYGIPAQSVEATRLVVTDDHFQAAVPLMDRTTQAVRQTLLPMLESGQVPVVTGFIGATANGIVTTLGRGGSDYSAAILGVALPANEVWIFTDVDGVMTADPRIVPEARTIDILNFREVAELAYFGAKVLHPKTIHPVIDAGIGLRVCNTFNAGHPGSRIVAEEMVNGTGRIKAVTAIRGLHLITLEGRGMLGVPGVAARTFAAVASTGTSVPLITQASSEQSICFAVPSSASSQVIAALKSAFAQELARGDIDSVWATGEVEIITVVGAGMRHTPGIAGKVFSTLGANHVNVIAIAQGSSEVSISLVVDAGDGNQAVKALHKLIIA